MTLTEFLLARIAEDEATANAASPASGPGWKADDGDYYVSGRSVVASAQSPRLAAHMARHDPARVLAECAAKRAIIGSHDSAHAVRADNDVAMAYNDGECYALDTALRHMAAVYASHPEYLQEWAL